MLPIKRHDVEQDEQNAIATELSRAFYVALLLTANATAAELAVLTAMETFGDADLDAEGLVYKAVESSLSRPRQLPDIDRVDLAVDVPTLPAELERLMQMEASLRRCFVLRMLLGFPIAICARLLHCNEETVIANTSAAAQWLALGNVSERGEPTPTYSALLNGIYAQN